MEKETFSFSGFEFPVFDHRNPPVPLSDYSPGALFLINKPLGWTSFDVVKFLKYRLNVKKIGHAGTLDPLATGLLILCSGKATKSVSILQEFPKRYRARVYLGASTPSQDSATPFDAEASIEHIEPSFLEDLLNRKFTGPIEQIPPMYSALWKDGKRLYTYARKGEVVDRSPRKIFIYEIKLLNFEKPHTELEILCSKGTYIRTLAHDLGIASGSFAHLAGLKRTEIGKFHSDDALSIEQLKDIFS